MRTTSLLPLLLVSLLAVACADASASEPSPEVAGARARRPPPPHPPISARARVEVVRASGARLPTFEHEGRTYVEGVRGERYKIRVSNPTGERVEAVVSVDGLDAIDGRSASRDKRGYVIEPFGTLELEGFRTSRSEVAAFRFSSVRDSYAARKGQPDDVGVIGVLLFRERAPIVQRAEPPRPSAAPRAGSGARSEERGRADDRPGLGTSFGERRSSRVVDTAFVRDSAAPFARHTLRYDDRDGLVAAGVIPERREEPEIAVRRRAEPFPMDRRFAEPPP
ncbi:MAG: hypothetical protein IT374_23210 [Polyangiaceae bacterium]|nr:hypothetical protein [Polyangiaceae bacterium]